MLIACLDPIEVLLDLRDVSFVRSEESSFRPESIVSVRQSRVRWTKDAVKNMKLMIFANEFIFSQLTFDHSSKTFTRKDLISSSFTLPKTYPLQLDIHTVIGVGEDIINDFSEMWKDEKTDAEQSQSEMMKNQPDFNEKEA